jgi:hypothetical protein
MDPKTWLSFFFVLILVYLLVENSKGTNTVVSALGSTATKLIQTLQGKGLTASVTMQREDENGNPIGPSTTTTQ